MIDSLTAVAAAREARAQYLIRDYNTAREVNEDFPHQTVGQLLDLSAACHNYQAGYRGLMANQTPSSPGFRDSYSDVRIYGHLINQKPAAHIGRALVGAMSDRLRDFIRSYAVEGRNAERYIAELADHSSLAELPVPRHKIMAGDVFLPPRVYLGAMRATENVLIESLCGSLDSLRTVELDGLLKTHSEIARKLSCAARWLILCDDKKQPMV